ncbi:uncharacterized protein METZ01_LOCUS125268 [marine metagenome]|uniref:Uncharacterized protein n=1 Tax=marine metagenome TaxID=408172 RepID=A0A381Y5W9_9ZZZZ
MRNLLGSPVLAQVWTRTSARPTSRVAYQSLELPGIGLEFV